MFTLHVSEISSESYTTFSYHVSLASFNQKQLLSLPFLLKYQGQLFHPIPSIYVHSQLDPGYPNFGQEYHRNADVPFPSMSHAETPDICLPLRVVLILHTRSRCCPASPLYGCKLFVLQLISYGCRPLHP